MEIFWKFLFLESKLKKMDGAGWTLALYYRAGF
jgi:hypothetical protein